MNNQTNAQLFLPVTNLDLNELRQAIQREYKVVAEQPARGFHFHTGRPLDALGVEADEVYLNLEDGLREVLTVGRPIAGRSPSVLSDTLAN